MTYPALFDARCTGRGTPPKSILIALLGLLLCGATGNLYAQQTPVAGDNVFNVEAGATRTVDAPGVLGNDLDADDDSLVTLLVTPPAHGTLILRRDGSFQYTPDPGFTGLDQFTYRARVPQPQFFTVDAAQSNTTFSARVSTPIGNDADSDNSAITGIITADVAPSSSPFSEIHVTAMDMRLADAMSLSFSFSIFGGLDVDTDANAMQLVMAASNLEPGRLNSNSFAQVENMLGILGTITVDASGLLQNAVQDGAATLDTAAPMDLAGTLSQNGNTLRLDIPIDFMGTFDVSGNAVNVTLTGQLVATASAPSASEMSNVATVSLRVGAIGTDTETGDVPAAFALEQNYPNPFNPATTIAYTLPDAGPVTLTVYDALGRTVAVLTDGWQATGRHEVAFDASGLPGGVYLYHLQAGQHTATRRLVLLK